MIELIYHGFIPKDLHHCIMEYPNFILLEQENGDHRIQTRYLETVKGYGRERWN